MNLELLKCINIDMKWNILKKGRTGMSRRPRKLGEDGFDFGNKSTFETNKFGSEEGDEAPLKKLRLFHQSPQTPCINGEAGVSPGPQTPAVNNEDSGQRCRLDSLSQGKKTKSKTRLRKSNLVKPKKNNVCNLDDFSGIELLAAAACSSFVNDIADRVDDLFVSKEQTTAPGVKLCNVAIKEPVVLPELNASSIQVDNNDLPSKGLRLHWDLNTVMVEWEKPCADLLVESHSQENCSKNVNSTLEDYGSKCTDVVAVEEKSILDHNAAISVAPLVTGTKTLLSKISDGECENLSTSTTTVLREQTSVIGESDQQPISEEVMQELRQSPKLCKSSCDNRVTSEDPLSEGCGSNVTQDEQGLMTEGDSEEKLEVGYDSPFEDGELREPIEIPLYEKDDVGTAENTLSEKVDHGQPTEDQISLLVKETISDNDIIEQGSREDTFKSLDFSESFDVQRTRSSNLGDAYSRSGRESGVEKSSQRDTVMNQFHSRNYNPRGGAYRIHSPSDRNNGYGSRVRPPVRSHSRDRYRGEYRDFKPGYFERKSHFPPKFNRPRSRSRSRSGSPIAWNFQKRKNSDTSYSCEIEPITKDHTSAERSSKFTDDQNRDKRRSPVRTIHQNHWLKPIRYPERLRSDDHFRPTQHSARFSQMTGPGRDHRYKDNNEAIRKHDTHYEKVNRLGLHDDGFRRVRDNESFEHRSKRNLGSFSKDSPKEQTSHGSRG